MVITSVDGKVIGTLEAGVFLKKVHGRIHMLHTPPSWAIDSRAFEQDLRGSCRTIVVEDIDSSLRYSVDFNLFDEKKGRLTRGYGEQYFLPLKHWRIGDRNQSSMF